MKILIVSLLRLGDLILQRPLLRALREMHPDAELHVLTNASCQAAESLLWEVDHWFYFDRDGTQEVIGEAGMHLLQPLRDLEPLLRELDDQTYDLAFNFTHNRLSAAFMELISAKEKRGLVSEGRGFRSFDNEWLRFFNERFGSRRKIFFPYTELLGRSFGLPVTATRARAGSATRILIQALTSDEKKNWGLPMFRQLKDLLHATFPDREIQVLGAPFEAEKLRTFFGEDELTLCDLAELKREFGEAALLISGDTSVKHIAVQEGLPVLELALGSADPDKTGVYGTGGLILQGRVACAPCPHRTPCRQISHLCGESLSPRVVHDAATAILDSRIPAFVQNLDRTQSVDVFEVKVDDRAGWLLRSLRAPASAFAADFIEKILWTLDLEEPQAEFIAAGTAARQVIGGLAKAGVAAALPVALTQLKLEQEELTRIGETVETTLEESARLCVVNQLDPSSLARLRACLSGLATLSDRMSLHLQPVMELGTTSFATPFHFFGALRKRLEEYRRRLARRKKLLEQIHEAGGWNESTARQVSPSGPETP